MYAAFLPWFLTAEISMYSAELPSINGNLAM